MPNCQPSHESGMEAIKLVDSWNSVHKNPLRLSGRAMGLLICMIAYCIDCGLKENRPECPEEKHRKTAEALIDDCLNEGKAVIPDEAKKKLAVLFAPLVAAAPAEVLLLRIQVSAEKN